MHALHGAELKRVHGTIEKEGAELATQSACATQGGAKVSTSEFMVCKEFTVRKEFMVQ